ncbi:MAG: glycosyltransferase [Cytophagaceae bacterium]|jgi:glycosyltransferase involved in cell wall biosynthesis|nr:glycosyltransferase [Cytophagaceae bacterium]
MNNQSLQSELKSDLDCFLAQQLEKYPRKDLLKIDLHCHDCNSDEPDELIGRILNVPETWIPTQRVVEELELNGCEAITITNHNNARSCYALRDKGADVLTAAEFSCMVPDFNIGIHVLAYGFTPEHEKRLDKLRRNVYAFQEYTCANDIPTIWAHPLYHYAADRMPPMEFFERMLLIFERFEMLNGQRDTWQNMLVKEWIGGVTPEMIQQLAAKYSIDPAMYCRNPYRKALSGGSDSHAGFFAGLTATYLYIPNLAERLKITSRSQLALEAIRKSDMIPCGSHQNSEKLTIAFLDYVCQIALNYRDPGLLRILLHKGKNGDKAIALFASNAFAEMQRHKVTMSFVEIFHNCLLGKSPSMLKKFVVSSSYKPVFEDVVKMAKEHQSGTGIIAEEYYRSIYSINSHLNELLFSRLAKKIAKTKWAKQADAPNIERLIAQVELPSCIRAYTEMRGKGNSGINLEEFLDGLSFPFLASSLLLSAHFTSARVLFNTRPFLKEFSVRLGKYRHSERALWLTDTFEDRNGVSTALQAMLREIKRRNLPVDLLVCSNTLEADDHLIVLKPVCEFQIPFYADQPVRVPNFVELHNLFHEREYDRVICSTEGIMGAMGLYLKHAYSVAASFFIHTDWVMFCRKTLNFDAHNLNRIRRILRSYYGAFDRVFVLNSDQRKWLTGREMNFDESRVCLTAHWADAIFSPVSASKKEAFGINNSQPVMLYVGRVSKEKGVMELPRIFKGVKKLHPNIALAVVGHGPALDELKTELPDAIYLNWVQHEQLPAIYSAANVLVFPSKFDTFSCTVLESLSCGLPVVAYNTKGPKDIIDDGVCGYLANTVEQMIERVAAAILANSSVQIQMRKAAVARAANYDVDKIVEQFMGDVGLNG